MTSLHPESCIASGNEATSGGALLKTHPFPSPPPPPLPRMSSIEQVKAKGLPHRARSDRNGQQRDPKAMNADHSSRVNTFPPCGSTNAQEDYDDVMVLSHLTHDHDIIHEQHSPESKSTHGERETHDRARKGQTLAVEIPSDTVQLKSLDKSPLRRRRLSSKEHMSDSDNVTNSASAGSLPSVSTASSASSLK